MRPCFGALGTSSIAVTSPADRLSDDAALLLELTGAPQAWLALCQEVIAARAAPAPVALIEDEAGPWARALRTGREVRDAGDDLSLEPEIFDVRAAHALRRLTAVRRRSTCAHAGPCRRRSATQHQRL
jgi:hypothetical protein